MKGITRMHGVSKVIVSNRDQNFTLNFWRRLFIGFGTKMNLSITYYPQINRKIERELTKCLKTCWECNGG